MVVCACLFVFVSCSLFVVGDSLSVACCLLGVARCSLCIRCRWLFLFSLVGVRCLLFVVYCVLVVVSCLLFVACRVFLKCFFFGCVSLALFLDC